MFFNSTNLIGNLKALFPYLPLNHMFSLKVYTHMYISVESTGYATYCTGAFEVQKLPSKCYESVWQGLLKVKMNCFNPDRCKGI